jgi:hypothetical protein
MSATKAQVNKRRSTRVKSYPRFFSGLGVKPRRCVGGDEEGRFWELCSFALSWLTFSTASLTRFFSALFMKGLYSRSALGL